MRRAFIVGRRNRRTTTVIVLRHVLSPFLGPWTLTAVVSAN
ncbi:MAG TPA: hypothetical protein VK939_15895 [Longimicrobiales bacterium]|nr:hypothetical protein [Longimicrobiales bacterium]